MPYVLRSVALAFILCFFGGCATRNADFGDVRGIATQADYRIVTERRRKPAPGGDEKVVCTEPSPDVAKAFSDALKASGGDGTVTADIAYSHAETIAQLGKRYATVQLLRDILYRNCEDYANGAINDAVYSYRATHFDQLVVTLLGIEMLGSIDPGTPAQVSSATLSLETDSSGKTTASTSTKPASTSQGGQTPALSKATTTSTAAGDSPTKAGAPAGDSTTTTLSAAQAVEAATKALAAAKAQAAALKVAQTVTPAEKTAIGGVQKLDKNVQAAGTALGNAWSAILKAGTKPDQGVTTSVAKLGTSLGSLTEGMGTKAADGASDKVKSAGNAEDTAISALTDANKALNSLMTALAPTGSEKDTPQAGMQSADTASAIKAEEIEQMQWNFLRAESMLELQLPCASALRNVDIGLHPSTGTAPTDGLAAACKELYPALVAAAVDITRSLAPVSQNKNASTNLTSSSTPASGTDSNTPAAKSDAAPYTRLYEQSKSPPRPQ